MLVCTSDNSAILPASAISLTASNGSGTLIFTPVSGQSGTLNITLTISDGIKTIYSVIPVTVNPDYAFDANLVLNANGESKTWWIGRTSEETSCLTAQGTYFQINSGSPCVYEMAPYQELDLGKFTALIDQGWAGFSSNCSVTQSGTTIPSCYFVALNSAREVIDTIAKSGVETGIIPSNTRYIQATMRGFSGDKFTGFSFIMTAAGFPEATPIADQTIRSGENTGALSFVFGYKGSAPTLTMTSSNTAVVPGANIVLGGVNYSRTVTVSAPTGVSGSSTITIKTGTTTLLSFVVTVTGLPGSPTIGTATAGDAQATVSFTAPASNGGATITSYTVTSNPGSITATGTASPLIITGLTNGTSYTFTVTATNSVGTGPASTASNAVISKGIQTITFDEFSDDVIYGAVDFAPSASITSGLDLSFASDNEAVATITAGGLVHVAGAGSANIEASQAGSSAYTAATPVSKTLTVKKAPLVITARDTSIMEGDTDPVFQFTFSGFVNEEDSSVLTDLQATRNPGLGDGTYTITPSASSENYEITFVNGVLTIIGTTAAKVLNSGNVQLQYAMGRLSVRGLRGNLNVFSINGSVIANIRIDHDGIYTLNLRSGRYVFCLGSRTWTVEVQPR